MRLIGERRRALEALAAGAITLDDHQARRRLGSAQMGTVREVLEAFRRPGHFPPDRVHGRHREITDDIERRGSLASERL